VQAFFGGTPALGAVDLLYTKTKNALIHRQPDPGNQFLIRLAHLRNFAQSWRWRKSVPDANWTGYREELP
jgi:hypothetical protein